MSTPVQRQYQALKAQNPEAILFFRLGDFYEMFHEDALIASRVLGITLTARHKDTENEMPMCGFPFHAHEPYLETLIEQGYKVAVAEQVTDAEGNINRVIDRVITPGTTLENGNLNPGENNFLLAVHLTQTGSKFEACIAHTDSSTGLFKVCQIDQEIDFWDEIYRLNPREILCETTFFESEDLMNKMPEALITPRPSLKLKPATQLCHDHFGANHLEVAQIAHQEKAIITCAILLEYLQSTHKTDLSHLQRITHYRPGAHMMIDRQTATHLEIFQNLDGTRNSTLMQVFAKPKTAMGGRMLYQYVAYPLLKTDMIDARLEANQELIENFDLHQNCLETLSKIADIERLLARLASGKGHGRDLAFFRESLAQFPILGKTLENTKAPLLKSAQSCLEGFETLSVELSKALAENPPLTITEGGIFKTGYDAKLDELRTISQDSNTWLETFIAEQKEATGLSNLRVKYSKNFGFCLEISRGQVDLAPAHWERRQTLVNAERFTTPELSEYESKFLGAETEAFALEHELFLQLKDQVLTHLPSLQEAAKAVGTIDALASLAQSAKKGRWTKPEIVDHGTDLKIIDGRHPVIEALGEAKFIPNSCLMSASDGRFHLISGPNMAGKSTFLRQNALIILLGQIGSFVPAKKASWSVVDRIFTRVGASDNLAAGQSTFFVEMTESAAILNAATQRSFIILDEIGRGTSTFDGISIAWAITDFLHSKIQAKTLFATHYHELIELAESLPAAKNYHVSVDQNPEGIVFLHTIKPGGMADSFGIEVAKLAGIPREIIVQAREVLGRLESENRLFQTPNLFTQNRRETPTKSTLETEIEKINPDQMSPKEALEVLYKLKEL